jgi:hypothetical protein
LGITWRLGSLHILMISCIHHENNTCKIASKIAGLTVTTTQKACDACSNEKSPMQENNVTYSIALKQLGNTNPAASQQIISQIVKLQKPEWFLGPGTELKNLISWFYSPDKKKCKCASRIAKMNKWGPDGCEQRMNTILRWLKHSAKINNIPYFEPAVRILVRKAIKNSRLQLQQHQEKTVR